VDQSAIDNLLVNCLRAAPGEAAEGRFEARSAADWDAVIDASSRHGVAPLLYQRLGECLPGVPVPPRQVERLRRAYLENGARNMGVYHELGKVLAGLRRDNIDVIVLKGAHLADLVYGNHALRFMSDVDLLVYQDDLSRVEERLVGMGYVPAECHRQVAADNCHFLYRLPDREMFVEVHWALMPSMHGLHLDTDGQWGRARPATIAGVEAWVLCPEDLLTYLCVHASKHGFEVGLKPLVDIVETIRSCGHDIDWQLLRDRSAHAGVAKCLGVAFRLAREMLGASVPDDLTRVPTSDGIGEMYAGVARERVLARGHGNDDGASLSPTVARVWEKGRLLQRGLLLLRSAFPSRATMARMYPAPANSLRVWFCYPVRIKDILLRHGRHLWLLLTGDERMQAAARRKNAASDLRDWLLSP